MQGTQAAESSPTHAHLHVHSRKRQGRRRWHAARRPSRPRAVQHWAAHSASWRTGRAIAAATAVRGCAISAAAGEAAARVHVGLLVWPHLRPPRCRLARHLAGLLPPPLPRPAHRRDRSHHKLRRWHWQLHRHKGLLANSIGLSTPVEVAVCPLLPTRRRRVVARQARRRIATAAAGTAPVLGGRPPWRQLLHAGTGRHALAAAKEAAATRPRHALAVCERRAATRSAGLACRRQAPIERGTPLVPKRCSLQGRRLLRRALLRPQPACRRACNGGGRTEGGQDAAACRHRAAPTVASLEQLGAPNLQAAFLLPRQSLSRPINQSAPPAPPCTYATPAGSDGGGGR